MQETIENTLLNGNSSWASELTLDELAMVGGGYAAAGSPGTTTPGGTTTTTVVTNGGTVISPGVNVSVDSNGNVTATCPNGQVEGSYGPNGSSSISCPGSGSTSDGSDGGDGGDGGGE